MDVIQVVCTSHTLSITPRTRSTLTLQSYTQCVVALSQCVCVTGMNLYTIHSLLQFVSIACFSMCVNLSQVGVDSQGPAPTPRQLSRVQAPPA